MLLKYYSDAYNSLFSELKNDSINISSFGCSDTLVVLDETTDLLRLVRANFKYDSKTFKCIYDFAGIEDQLINENLRGKLKIKYEEKSVNKFFEYSDKEVTKLSDLNKLNNQTWLAQESEIKLFNEFKSANEIEDALKTLKLIMNYANNLKIDYSETVYSFVKKIYSNDPELLNQSERILKFELINNTTQLKHLKHAWMILSVKQCIVDTKNERDPFEKLKDVFKQNAFTLNLEKSYSEERLISHLTYLYQMISFDFSDQNKLDQSYMSSFRYLLMTFFNKNSFFEYIRSYFPTHPVFIC